MGRSCGQCHEPGALAPFSLLDYESAKPLAGAIAHSVKTQTMPPFFVEEGERCQTPLPWLGDIRLSAEERVMVQRWASAGAPLGDPATAAPVERPKKVVLDPIHKTIAMGVPVEVPKGPDLFKCVTIDPGFTEDTYINGAEMIPGNSNVLHHAIAYIDDKAESASKGPVYDCFGGPLIENPRILYAWAPGASPMTTPVDSAIKIPAGARVILNLHYHPTGADETDSETAVNLRFAPKSPTWLAETIFIGNAQSPVFLGSGLLPGPADPPSGPEFRIPAGAEAHTEHMKFTMPPELELRVWLMSTHMHYVGRKARLWIERQGSKQCLIDTPRWDFNWQVGYAYDGTIDTYPKVLGRDQIHVECEYNNSLSNSAVKQALIEQGLSEPIDVLLGEETLDEMCLGVMGFLIPNTEGGTRQMRTLSGHQSMFPGRSRR